MCVRRMGMCVCVCEERKSGLERERVNSRRKREKRREERKRGRKRE